MSIFYIYVGDCNTQEHKYYGWSGVDDGGRRTVYQALEPRKTDAAALPSKTDKVISDLLIWQMADNIPPNCV